ncbi:MAG: flagellar hook-basal body complex protein FliE [Pseudomonas sp.]|uniref:flagellar hook-basal body complex protein FliE n=1 Tax=Stenotrophomonas sp. TaxID=69392 RepID=UPI003D6CA045
MSIAQLGTIASLMPSAIPSPGLQPLSPANINDPIGFGEMLMAGAVKVDGHVKVADQAAQAFAMGADIPPHQVMLALEEARMSLHFALQVRTRFVEAYQELMRMQL